MKFLSFASVFHIWKSFYTVYKMIFTTVVTEINSLFMSLIKLRDTLVQVHLNHNLLNLVDAKFAQRPSSN